MRVKNSKSKLPEEWVGTGVNNSKSNSVSAVHICPYKIIFSFLIYEKFLGVLTIWRKPGNLDKTRTRTYYMGEVSKPEAKTPNGRS